MKLTEILSKAFQNAVYNQNVLDRMSSAELEAHRAELDGLQEQMTEALDRYIANVSSTLETAKRREQDEAEITISENGYNGFCTACGEGRCTHHPVCTAGGAWYCTHHAIEILFGGDPTLLVAFCTGKATELKTPEGVSLDAIHDGTIDFESNPRDYYPEGLYCSVFNCPAEIVMPLEDRD